MTNVPYPQYPQPGQPAPYAMQPAPKSKVTAALLAFFLGEIGIHNFYLGQKGRGIGHIALAVIAVILYIVAIAAAVGNADQSGELSDAGAAGFGGAMLFSFLVGGANTIWKLVEFIMILVKNDGSLR